MADEEIFLFYFNSFFFFKVKRYLDTKLGLNRKKKNTKNTLLPEAKTSNEKVSEK